MNTLQKFELIEKIERELEDLKNSQTAVLQKITKIEVDNIELSDKKLEDKLPDIHQSAADIIDTIDEIFSNFAEVKTQFESKNNIGALKEQEALKGG
ncbi:hypothetical protein GS399_07005 [Pedobacter sp. HMF7647]|uniref:Uncharacterized protein n=1 Tax=Hufsiella arboris TaxID=2695275 RepID=A0A7K1Y9I9_9SPHI|nr:hypothetical protein [Hufsiella arboris]MXV50718.1 hypothetical protein [Hufsiella arboris]